MMLTKKNVNPTVEARSRPTSVGIARFRVVNRII